MPVILVFRRRVQFHLVSLGYLGLRYLVEVGSPLNLSGFLVRIEPSGEPVRISVEYTMLVEELVATTLALTPKSMTVKSIIWNLRSIYRVVRFPMYRCEYVVRQA
jgi:hypothetical protein